VLRLHRHRHRHRHRRGHRHQRCLDPESAATRFCRADHPRPKTIR